MSRFSERRLLVRIAASIALLALLLWRIDLPEAGRALRDANYVYVVPGLALFGLAKLLVAQRWRIMMSTFAVLPLPPLFGILLVSNLANNIVPARIGDLIRVQVPAQRYDVSRARLAATVFATESLLDGIAFAVLGLIGLALIDLPNFPTGVFWGVLGAVSGGLIAVIPLSHLKLQDGWTGRGVMPLLPDRARLALEEAVPHFIDGLAVFRNARLGAEAIALSFAIWLIEVGMFALFGLRFRHPPFDAVVDADHGRREHDQLRADYAVEHRCLRGGDHGANESVGRGCRCGRRLRDRSARVQHRLDHRRGLHRHVGAGVELGRCVLVRAEAPRRRVPPTRRTSRARLRDRARAVEIQPMRRSYHTTSQ